MAWKVVIFCALLFVIEAAIIRKNDLLELSVIHLNDFHARFEEVNKAASPCKETDECIGGFSRVYTAVQELLKRPNAIFLNAGDNFQGTIWYNIHGWNVTQYFLNKLSTDAYTLGNHEFDHKMEGLVPFIKSLKGPTVVANIDDSLEPEIQGTFQKSTIIERDGRKIGIVGVIVKNTNELSSTEGLKFLDELTSVNQEAIHLHQLGCNIIIVLSHCGYDVDVEIARQLVPHVNLIVGGHSHSLLYNGIPPSEDTVRGPYPTVVERENGRNVLVVQAAAYTKYLGNLSVWFNERGDVVRWEGKPVYLDRNIKQDPEINKEIDIWKKSIDEYSKRVIGSTKVTLNKETCYYQECNLGDFVTDAMIDNLVSKAEPNTWTYAALAIMNSGGMRTSLSPGNITYEDMISVLPFESTVDVGELTGDEIKECLEFSVNDTVFENSYKQYLQVSGIKVTYNLTNTIGSRVVSLELRCRECTEPKFEPYKPKQLYRIAMTSFLAGGGDGYSVIKNNLRNHEKGPVDLEIVEKYLAKKSPIDIGLSDRITVVT